MKWMHNFGNIIPENQNYKKVQDFALNRFVLKLPIKAAAA